jgi:hypothetical protein
MNLKKQRVMGNELGETTGNNNLLLTLVDGLGLYWFV